MPSFQAPTYANGPRSALRHCATSLSSCRRQPSHQITRYRRRPRAYNCAGRMMMVDLAAFADEQFSAKAWVNEACKTRHSEDPIDKHLGDLEMKLQLMSENIASYLDEQSSASLFRVPRASREIVRLHDDAISLRSTVSTILQRLKKAEDSCKEPVAALARVDMVKQRMEASHETLQDAAGLAQLSANIENIFASGDLPRVAETLANMRRCLGVIGEVAEFANLRRQLEVLEDRLEGMVQPQLSDALTNKKVEAMRGLRDILVTIGRYKSLEEQYTRVRLKPLRRIWEEYDSGKGSVSVSKPFVSERPGEWIVATRSPIVDERPASFAEWLSHFYDEVLLYLEQEWKWCSLAFPESYKSLVSKLLVEIMSSIATSFSMRIEACFLEALAWPDDKAEKVELTQLGLLIMLHNVTGTFARNVQRLFGSVEAEEMVTALRAIYLSYEGYKDRYGDMELAHLTDQLNAMDLRRAISRGVGARGLEVIETVRRMEASIPSLSVLLEAAIDRCLTFTGGSEVEALLLTLDEIVRLYLVKLQDMLKSLRVVCGVDLTKSEVNTGMGRRESGVDGINAKKEATMLEVVSDEEEWAIVQGVLQSLNVSENLSKRFAIFEATLRATLDRLGSHLDLSKLVSSIGPSGVLSLKDYMAHDSTLGDAVTAILSDVAVLRLLDVPDKARRLNNLLEQAKDMRFHALAHSSSRVSSFIEAVNKLVYDVLIAKVHSRLADVSQMPIWGAEEEENAFDLPSFSAYASPHITSIGEYLLTLPQQLEPVMMSGAANGLPSDGFEESIDEVQFFATEWMFKVADGAVSLYVDQLRGIPFVSNRGALQLSADIDYLYKVLSALSMQVPPVLATFQVCFSTSKEALPEVVKAGNEKHLDMATARLVCKMRRVPLD